MNRRSFLSSVAIAPAVLTGLRVETAAAIPDVQATPRIGDAVYGHKEALIIAARELRRLRPTTSVYHEPVVIGDTLPSGQVVVRQLSLTLSREAPVAAIHDAMAMLSRRMDAEHLGDCGALPIPFQAIYAGRCDMLRMVVMDMDGTRRFDVLAAKERA
jgi:hypothetical protein